MAYDCPEIKTSEWLVMVYLAGDNNLSAHSIACLQELEAANYNSDVRVVAAFDSTTPWPKGARYLEINRHRDASNPYQKKIGWPLHNDLVKPGHMVVSPDFCGTIPRPPKNSEPIAEESLARFFDWIKKCYTAKHYMLLVFGHGVLVAGNTFLTDTNPPSYLKLGTFTRILKKHFGEKIDILACDNCVMNGIETAVELYPQVDFMIGSQDLMLANGWPMRKIINAVTDHYTRGPAVVAEQILRTCARNLLDFALMERSSEQSIVDVRQFGKDDKLMTAVRGLSAKLQEGLQFKRDSKDCDLLYPVVRDLVRLARLEAQSYWAETFVDLYDFAALLLERCNQFIATVHGMVNSLTPFLPRRLKMYNMSVKDVVRPWPLVRMLEDISFCCKQITDVFHNYGIVPHAYYVCPQLQYSHGISIYFPWALPEGPITFEPVPDSRAKFGDPPKDFNLKTPFEEYETYSFAGPEYGDWTCFLKAFFRATLRNVRVVEYEYQRDGVEFFRKERRGSERTAPVIDLVKSGQDKGDRDDCTCPQIKNYPRRFYLSPGDCRRRMTVFGLPGNEVPTEQEVTDESGKVSYLGWNIRGLLAEEIGLPAADAPNA